MDRNADGSRCLVQGGATGWAVSAGDMPHHSAALLTHLAARRSTTARGPLPLDYSVASLRLVDFLVDGLRQGSDPQDGPLPPMLVGLGAYVGEVLVRRAGAVWVNLDASQRQFFGQRVGVRMPDGRVRSPLGKIENRYRIGAEESLHTFYLTLSGRSRRRPYRS